MRLRLVGALCMIALVVPALALGAEVVKVTVKADGLDPADITINRGDIVQWVWESGSHTLVNGESLDDPNMGQIFEFQLSKTDATLQRTFDEPGVIHYFAKDQVAIEGSITVKDVSPVERATWSFLKQMFESGAPVPRPR
jgi:plastocyanin